MRPLKNIKRVIISRTDSIGDVILTLPMAGLLKEMFPGIKVLFLCKEYTAPLLHRCSNIDEVITLESILQGDLNMQVSAFKELRADAIIHVYPRFDLARLACKAGVTYRIGSTGRIYHYRYCNKLVTLSRRRSERHEAELNTFLLRPFGLRESPGAEQLIQYYGLTDQDIRRDSTIDIQHPAIILHPGSRGSAREWKLEHFAALSQMLTGSAYQVYLTGTEEEGRVFRKILCQGQPGVIDLSGRMNLVELMDFIAAADGLVAASTGPLHIAAALGKLAVGIYPPIRPMHPGRWRPLGLKAFYLSVEKNCNDCSNGAICHCMQAVSPMDVFTLIMNKISEK